MPETKHPEKSETVTKTYIKFGVCEQGRTENVGCVNGGNVSSTLFTFSVHFDLSLDYSEMRKIAKESLAELDAKRQDVEWVSFREEIRYAPIGGGRKRDLGATPSKSYEIFKTCDLSDELKLSFGVDNEFICESRKYYNGFDKEINQYNNEKVDAVRVLMTSFSKIFEEKLKTAGWVAQLNKR